MKRSGSVNGGEYWENANEPAAERPEASWPEGLPDNGERSHREGSRKGQAFLRCGA